MPNFFVVFDRREQGAKQVEGQKFENVTLLGKKDFGTPRTTGQLEDACVIRVETGQAGAPGIEEAQRAVQHFWPGLNNSTPVVITEAAFKES